MTMRRILAILLLTLSPPALAGEGEDGLMAAYRSKTQVIKPCDRSGSAIVVCGNRAERNARERLPLPREPDSDQRIVGDVPRASAAPVRQGGCGVSGGQGAGCTGGLPVFQIVGAIVQAGHALIDPDADLAPPPPLPDRFRGSGQH